MSKKIINPILPGFYPDPSICEANGSFYLANSSFVFFPGLPLFKSEDCITWTQIANIIDRPEQMTFIGESTSRGLFAPTIRFYNGTFYCVCTNIDNGGNFFVTAKNPEGPWSNPIWIKKADGIDPSFFFDDDGSCWYVGTHEIPTGAKWNGNYQIYMQKVDFTNGDLTGPQYGIWQGALKKCIWPEGPHVYKINGTYYLFHAEGGTSFEHAECVAKSNAIDSEWVGKPANPLITHRHLGKNAGICCVGHGDIVCDKNNQYWMVLLATRPFGNEDRCSNLGRETFMVPVKWEDGWPVASWETGLVEHAYDQNGHVVNIEKDDVPAISFPETDDFNSDSLSLYWISPRSYNKDYISLTENKGYLRLYGSNKITSLKEVSCVARRQTSFSFEVTSKMKIHFVNEMDSAGLVCFQNEGFQYRIQLILKNKKFFLQVIKTTDGNDSLIFEEIVKDDITELFFKITEDLQSLKFEYGTSPESMKIAAEKQDARILSVEKAGGFVGTVLGMYAESTSNHVSYADFDFFTYKNTSDIWTNPLR